MSKDNKGLPIPVRFSPEEEALLNATSKRSGLTKSELIRRAVYLLNFEIQRRGGKVGWISDELTPGYEPPESKARDAEAERLEALRVAEEITKPHHLPSTPAKKFKRDRS